MSIDIERLKIDADYWDEVAPEGAEYVHKSKPPMFYKGDSYWSFSDRQWKKSKSLEINQIRLSDLIPRPTTPPAPKWNGEGLPPVGCECEYCSDSEPMSPDECNLSEHCIVDTWIPGDRLEVIALAKMPLGAGLTDIPVVQNKRNHQVSSIMARFIRPIRTKEQREREELVKVVCDTAAEISASTIEELAFELYDRGMLKERNQ